MTIAEPFVDLEDVKNRLNIDLNDTSDDDELTLFLESACGVLVDLYGDVLPQSYTEIVRPYGDGSRILLGRSPVLSVQSLAVGWYGSPMIWTPIASTWYRLDGGAGVIYALGYGLTGSFANLGPSFGASFGGNGYDPQLQVTYTAGRSAVTAQVQDAVLEILRINWQPQRTGYSVVNPLANSDPDEGFTYLGYYIPNGVHERLAGGKRPRQIG